jgi:hypothetical protein
MKSDYWLPLLTISILYANTRFMIHHQLSCVWLPKTQCSIFFIYFYMYLSFANIWPPQFMNENKCIKTLFFCGLLYDAVSISDYIAANDTMISVINWRKIWKAAVKSLTKVLSWHLSEGLRKTIKTWVRIAGVLAETQPLKVQVQFSGFKLWHVRCLFSVGYETILVQ